MIEGADNFRGDVGGVVRVALSASGAEESNAHKLTKDSQIKFLLYL